MKTPAILKRHYILSVPQCKSTRQSVGSNRRKFTARGLTVLAYWCQYAVAFGEFNKDGNTNGL